jgi:selenium metabolism protein YedF
MDLKKENRMTEMVQNQLTKEGCRPEGIPEDRGRDGRKTLVLLATEQLGKGDEGLGRSIVTSFIKTLKEMDGELWRLVLVNGAVKLAVEGAEVLPQLQELAGEGVGILVCGRCLETFGLADKKQVGEVTNMVDIVTSVQVAEKVISLT